MMQMEAYKAIFFNLHNKDKNWHILKPEYPPGAPSPTMIKGKSGKINKIRVNLIRKECVAPT